MTTGEKTMRLSKVARELNIGLSTIFDFLDEKGLDIEKSPNAKISGDVYDVLLGEFQAEKAVKEESLLLGLDKTEKETITMGDTVKPPPGKKEGDDIVVTDVQPKTADAPPEPEEKEEKKVERAGVKVVGKIDVSTKEKAKPKKAAEEDKPPADEEKPKEAKEEEKVDPKSPAPEEIIKATSEKLAGPKVVGAIELPKKVEREDKKKLVASSSDNLRGKKKRRRIKTETTGPPKTSAKKGTKEAPSEEDIQKQIKETLSRLSDPTKSKSVKYRRQKREAVSDARDKELELEEEGKKTLTVTEFVSANELSTMMGVPVNEVISSCMELGLFVSINQRLDAETISIVAEEFGYKLNFVSAELSEDVVSVVDKEEDLMERPPIVTVMGHVDHGKTSLLDNIRKANVIDTEAGGITQHIGAYEVKLESGKQITFLDTPGHEAFTAMRARGAQVTDVVIIIIAADDNIMPQTVEAINHAQAAGVPIVIAVNKIDKPGANPDKIKEELSNMNILIEEWGGKYQSQDISAKQGTNIEELLEKVVLEAEMLELKANPNRAAEGTVIESSLDKGKGYISTVLVQNGTLKVGDTLVAGSFSGKVKALYSEKGEKVKDCGPAMPVVLLGLNGAPQSGDLFNVMSDEKEAKEIASRRMQLQREQGVRTQKHITLDEIGRRIAIGDFKELNIIIKGDVDGSIEALTDSMQKLSTEQIQLNIIHKSVGQIIESDVLLASASNAIIVGFQVRPSSGARKLAEQEQIDIRLYSVIYDAINEIQDAMEGLLEPTIEEKITCNVEIREVFKITKVGTIAGCMVKDGKITRKTKVRVIRDGIVVYTGALGSLKRFKDDVKEVATGYECGLNIENFNDMEVGDVIEGYEEVAVKKKLQS
ncbi:MAG: translation initiation factor IF-2 [Flavobacteriales bacterium]|nr:translation initiation factor IF-2 [Flavobacteriales bacterium]